MENVYNDSVMVVDRPVRRSASIAALAAALAKAQGEIEGASKAKVNPHFKSSYADLASCWDACREPLSKNGLAVMQPASSNGPQVTVTTMLAHSSGEWIEGDFTMTATQNTPQGVGSCLTYARRYALCAMVGIAPEDDDGETASRGNGTSRHEAKTDVSGPTYDEWIGNLKLSVASGTTPDDILKTITSGPAAYKDTLRKDTNTMRLLGLVKHTKPEVVPA